MNLEAATRTILDIRAHTNDLTGCGTWEAPGVRAMLLGSDAPPGATIAAAALAAEDPSLRWPTLTALRNHWPANASTTAVHVPNVPTCGEHPTEPLPCPTCAAGYTPPTRESIEAALAAARDARTTTDHRPELPADMAKDRARADRLARLAAEAPQNPPSRAVETRSTPGTPGYTSGTPGAVRTAPSRTAAQEAHA